MSALQYNFDDTWDGLLSILSKSGPAQVVATISNETDLKVRNAWFRFAYQGLVFREWPGKNLDAMIVIGEAAIDNALVCAEGNPAEMVWWTDQANVHCYNLSANLADCWDDGIDRETRHFVIGHAFAERAIKFRNLLKKPAGPMAMAFWAKGKHLLSMHKFSDARQTFLEELVLEQQIAAEKATPVTLTKDAHFGLILCHGLLALCDLAEGNTAADATFNLVLKTFEAKKMNSDDEKAEGELGIGQLVASRRRLGF